VKPGPDTHGSQVAKVHGQGLVTQFPRPAPLFAEVDVLQQHVGAESPVFSGACRMKDGRIVSNPHLERGASPSKPVPKQADDLVLAPGCWPRLPVRSDFSDHPFTTKARMVQRSAKDFRLGESTAQELSGCPPLDQGALQDIGHFVHQNDLNMLSQFFRNLSKVLLVLTRKHHGVDLTPVSRQDLLFDPSYWKHVSP
jgi:hypothetical protein